MFVGDGSYLMMNSDLYSSVLSGHKLIVIVCDNGGFAVINRLQVNQGGVAVQQPHRRRQGASEVVEVDFAAHAAAMGCEAETVDDRSPSWRPRSDRARAADRTYVIAIEDVGVRLDRGRLVLGGRRARGQRPRARSGPPGRRWTPARPANEWAGERHGWRGDRPGRQGRSWSPAARRASARPSARLAAQRGAAGVAVVGRDTAEGRDGRGRADATSAPTRCSWPSTWPSPTWRERVIDAVDEHFGVVHGLVNAAAETEPGRRVGRHDASSSTA